VSIFLAFLNCLDPTGDRTSDLSHSDRTLYSL